MAHGSDVRCLLGAPRIAREHVVQTLLRSHATLRFASADLLGQLLATLDAPLGRRLAESARVELPPLELPDVAERSQRAVAELELDPARPVWVAAGRLIASKRVDLAMRESARNGATLLVIGDGPERGALERLARALPTPVRFLGHRPRHEALAFIAAADRLVHLSEAEGAPTVIREARAFGVPVLAAPVGDVARWAAADPEITLFHGGEPAPM